MSSRDAFLQRVRDAVAEGNRAGAPRALPERGSLGYQGAGTDAVCTFAGQLTALGGFCHIVSSLAEAVAKVLELLRNSGARKVLVGKGLPEQLKLAKALHADAFDVWDEAAAVGDRHTKATLFAADAGITGVDYLVAETGTLVVTTADGKGRSLSLLPPMHIALANRDQILPDLFDLFERLKSLSPLAEKAKMEPLSPLGERGRGEGVELPATSSSSGPLPRADGSTGFPACITLITGPSKTGDIELRLVTGVHGPGEVHVVLIA